MSPADLERRAAESPGDSDDNQARYEEWTRGLALFRLAPQEYDREAQLEARTKDIAGVYVPKDKTVLIVNRGAPDDDDQTVSILVHEFVHALQDAELDLGDYREQWSKTYDAELAVTGLIEGEAVLYQTLSQVEIRGFAPDQIHWEAFFQEWRTNQLLEAELDAAPVEMARVRFPYAYGGGFMMQHWLGAGRQAIDALFADPPQATREVLFGPTDEDLVLNVSDVREHGLPVLGPEFETQEFATLGAWVARMYAGRMSLPEHVRWDLARVLAADVFTVQYDAATGRRLAAWRLRSLASGDLAAWQTDVPAYVSTASSEQSRALDFIGSMPGVPPQPQTLEWKSVEMSEMLAMAATSSNRPAALLCASHYPSDLLREFFPR